jgi:hypothetical protein
MREARTRPENAAILRHAGGAKRGFERNHLTQPQIREGIGSRYPAKPMRVTRISAPFRTSATEVLRRNSLLTTIRFGQVQMNAVIGNQPSHVTGKLASGVGGNIHWAGLKTVRECPASLRYKSARTGRAGSGASTLFWDAAY